MRCRRLLSFLRADKLSSVWANITLRLITILQEIKHEQERLDLENIITTRVEEFFFLWAEYLEQFPDEEKYFMPNSLDAIKLPANLAIVTEDDYQIEVTPERFASSLPKALASETVLGQAISLLSCTTTDCGELLPFLALLSHDYVCDAARSRDGLVHHPQIPLVVKAVLSALYFPENMSLDALAQMGERFKCRCEDPQFQNQVTFLELVC
jgi:hypothetical protein